MTTRDHDTLVRRQFGASAENYRTSTSHARGQSLARLLTLTAPQPHWLALDVATGAGHTAATLAPRVHMVVAGDMTREMLQQAAVIAREQMLPNMRLVRESARALAYRDSVFDLVVCRVAAHHFPDPDRFVSESARVLKPGGCLAVIDNIVPDDEATGAWINDFERRRDPSHAQCLSVARWRDLFTRHALDVVHQEVNPKWFDFDAWMKRMNAAPNDIERMGREILDAPTEVRDFWQPRRSGSRIELALQEAILICRSSA